MRQSYLNLPKSSLQLLLSYLFVFAQEDLDASTVVKFEVSSEYILFFLPFFFSYQSALRSQILFHALFSLHSLFPEKVIISLLSFRLIGTLYFNSQFGGKILSHFKHFKHK